MPADFTERFVRRSRSVKGRAVNFRIDTVRLPNGVRAVREYLDHPGAVAVVPLLKATADPTLLFVRQYRYPVKEVTLELPAGKLGKGEPILPCVRRELEEETGFKARRIRKLLSYWPTAAFANEIIHVFLAQDLTHGHFHPDEDELLEPVKIRLSSALQMIRRGAIRDSKTIIGLLAFSQWKGL